MSQYYKKYMKKREEEKPSYLKLFIGALLIVMIFFVMFATHLMSSLDTSIGENDEGDFKESGLGVKHLIDSRLRFIQMEDRSADVSIKKEKPNDIEQYNTTINQEDKNGYSGQLQNTYGYEQTQQTKPYSQTYTNTQKQVEQAATHSAKTGGVQGVDIHVPAPTVKKTTTTSSPAHNIQKNLTPTGMN